MCHNFNKKKWNKKSKLPTKNSNQNVGTTSIPFRSPKIAPSQSKSVQIVFFFCFFFVPPAFICLLFALGYDGCFFLISMHRTQIFICRSLFRSPSPSLSFSFCRRVVSTTTTCILNTCTHSWKEASMAEMKKRKSPWLAAAERLAGDRFRLLHPKTGHKYD